MTVSGVYLNRRRQSYWFWRFYPDGAVIMASVGSPKPESVVIADVLQWFGRGLRLDPHLHAEHRYHRDGSQLSWSYPLWKSPRIHRVQATFQPDGGLHFRLTDDQDALILAGESRFLGSNDALMPEILDLNTATEAQLCSLPGVGPVLARRILDWRAQHGPLTSPQDLRQIRGASVVLTWSGHRCRI